METTRYDPVIIQKFADMLYAQARSIVATCTLIGLVAGGAVGYMLSNNPSIKTTYAVIGAVILGLIGFAIGQSRAFSLRLKAQTALCQMKIEQNTRSGKAVAQQDQGM